MQKCVLCENSKHRPIHIKDVQYVQANVKCHFAEMSVYSFIGHKRRKRSSRAKRHKGYTGKSINSTDTTVFLPNVIITLEHLFLKYCAVLLMGNMIYFITG